MGRYQYTTKTNDKEHKFRKQDTTLFPKVKPNDSDLYITTNIGDRLDLLAYKYYGDVTLWWIIAQTNEIGKGTLNIKPGTILRIPQDVEPIYSSLESINRRR